MTTARTALAVLAMAAFPAVAMAADGQEAQLTYSGSLQFASGTYTLSETTRSVLLFNGISYQKGRWTLSANIPLIYQDSPYVTYAAGTPVPSGRRLGETSGSSSGSTSSGTTSGSASGRGRGGTVIVPDPNTLDFNETGLGDPVLRADFSAFERPAQGLRLGVYGAFKPSVADEDSGFGTGESDYGAGLTVAKKIGSTLFLADVGYWVLGDLPDLELEDPVAFSVGVGRSLAGGRNSVLASVSGLTETIAGTDGPLQAAFTWSRLTPTGRAFSLTLAAGLTDSSPDYSVSTGWRVGL